MIEQQFIEYVVKQLVDKPDAVIVERIVDDRGILLKLTVAPEDLGRVIGKHGATAQSLRNLLRALGTKNDDHYNLKIIDVDKPESESETTEAPVKKTTTEIKDAVTETVEKVETVDKLDSETVENESDLAKKTREELADLDDLDI
ncbi:MAG: KH domain-containing protein [Candidatus Nomurabacteria bacterium]|nr:KH domain-containing protein [Candidatus Nomurabacteria bacterium]